MQFDKPFLTVLCVDRSLSRFSDESWYHGLQPRCASMQVAEKKKTFAHVFGRRNSIASYHLNCNPGLREVVKASRDILFYKFVFVGVTCDVLRFNADPEYASHGPFAARTYRWALSLVASLSSCRGGRCALATSRAAVTLVPIGMHIPGRQSLTCNRFPVESRNFASSQVIPTSASVDTW